MSGQTELLCVGEVLWDGLPDGLYLGGATLNVCYHLHQFEIEAAIASKVGEDRLGKEAIRRIEEKGIPTEFIQVNGDYETGFVTVEVDDLGEPNYRIHEPVAWDYITLEDKLVNVAENAWGMVFGSLAQRNKISRETIQKISQSARRIVFDLNLRKPYVDKGIVNNSLEVSDIVKMNGDELETLIKWNGLNGNREESVKLLAEKYDCETICITRGEKGSHLYHNQKWYTHPGYPVTVRDAVGAGDAFLAALVSGLKKNRSGEELLAFANAAGALVASRAGAMPSYAIQEINKFMNKDHS